MNRKRILFVDDEVAVLNGLENLLRKERWRWDMVFAAGATRALAELAKAPVDVIVTDMRMPQMDGAALLARVKEEYPGTARLVLSGHAGRDAVLRGLAVAHHFLSKPCDPDDLRIAIERTCHLLRLLEDQAIRRVVGTLEKLPSVPKTYVALTEAASRSGTGIGEIAKIIQSDPAMSVKVLQLANSAYFGRAQRVVSIQQAVGFLGLELLKGLALTAQAFTTLEAQPVEGFSLERLQAHSVLTARLAKRFLNSIDPKCGEEAFTAALVHDIGKIVIALALPTEFAEVAREARASDQPSFLVEKRLLGTTHAEIGAYLLGVWGLPFSIVESVAYHHQPGAITEGPRAVLAAVHTADALVETTCFGEKLAPAEARLDLGFLQSAGFGAEVDRWRSLVAEEAREVRKATLGSTPVR